MDEKARDFIYALGDRMVSLCGLACLSGLSEPERTVYCVYNLDIQVCNGGFSQFFLNTGESAPPTLVALERIGLPQTAGLLREALSVFPPGVEPGTDGFGSFDFSPEAEQFLDGLDDRFYEGREGVYEHLHAYAVRHPDGFRGDGEIEALVREREEAKQRRVRDIESLERLWARKERPCPKCGTRFVSVRDRGRCPACAHTFFASNPTGPDAYPYDGGWDLHKP